MSKGVPRPNTVEFRCFVHLLGQGLKSSAQRHHHERNTEPYVDENNDHLSTGWIAQKIEIGAQHIVHQTFGLEHPPPDENRNVRRYRPWQQQDGSVHRRSAYVSVLKHHGEKQSQTDVSRDVDHRPHQREQRDTQEARRREDLDEIDQTDEGLVAQSCCVRIGEGQPEPVQNGIEREHGKGEHGWSDVNVRRFRVQTTRLRIDVSAVIQQGDQGDHNGPLRVQDGGGGAR